MPYRHFQIPSYGGETEAAMTQFLNQHRVLKVEKQFVEAGLDSFWAFRFSTDHSLKPGAGAPGSAPDEGPEVVLSESNWSRAMRV